MTTATNDQQQQQQRHRQRNRSILTFFLSSLTSRGIGIGCQMLQVPLALAFLGSEAFGLWMTLNVIGYMLTFADLGIGMGAQNQIAEAAGRGDGGQARRIFFTGSVFLCAIMTGLLALAPASFLVDWQHVFRLTDPALARSAPLAIFAVIVSWCIGIPMGMAQRVALAMQFGWLNNVQDALRNVVTLLVIFVEMKLQSSFVTVIVSTAITGFAIQAGCFVYLLRRLGWLGMRPAWFQRALLGQLTNVGIFFFLQQIATLALFSAPPVILSAALGAAAVTPFNLAQRVFGPFQLVPNAYLQPIWPAYAEAKGRGDWGWIRQTFFRSIFVVTVLCILPMAAATCYMRPLIAWWTRGKAELPSQGLVWLLFGWYAITVLQQPFGFLLAGLSEVRRATLYSLLTTVSALGLIFAFIPHFGASALPMGLIIGFIPFVFCGNAVEAVIVLRRAARRAVPVAPLNADALAAAAPGSLETEAALHSSGSAA